jgi:hypothetical protein
MTRLIEITEDNQADFQPTGGNARGVEVMKLAEGAVIEAHVQCFVNDLGWNRLVEVADIFLADGTGTWLRVPCRSFRFRDE